MTSSNRDDFSSQVKAALAKRSGFLCAYCRALTIGPSAESPMSVSNLGVAAHITAAAHYGPRYDASITAPERSSVSNGIWLCQNHAKKIDDDCATWTVNKLRELKRQHEEYVTQVLGLPVQSTADLIPNFSGSPVIAPREYGFVQVRDLTGSYKNLVAPMLQDRGLTEDSELGVLMCGSRSGHREPKGGETPWTTFVEPAWLRWHLEAQNKGYKIAQEVPKNQIYGRIPAWPDSFFEFLQAIVETGSIFLWQRHRDGYLVLSQTEVR